MTPQEQRAWYPCGFIAACLVALAIGLMTSVKHRTLEKAKTAAVLRMTDGDLQYLKIGLTAGIKWGRVTPGGITDQQATEVALKLILEECVKEGVYPPGESQAKP